MIYIGIVEDIKDPLKIGRTKIRVKGVHTESKQQLPTNDLPWAAPMHPITSAAYEGIGYGGCGVVKGSQVVVIFRDPGEFQQPIVIGTLPGLFAGDPESEIRPNKESDLGRFATNNLIKKTIVQKKRDNVQKVTSEVVNFEEPPTPYATEYGESDVYMSRTGHIQEFDDTKDKERIHIYHRSGTFTEIHPDGTTVVRVEGDVFEIRKKNVNIYTEINNQEFIGGNSNENIVGNETRHIGGNEVETIVGNETRHISSNVSETIVGNETRNVNGNQSETIGGNVTVNISGNASFTVGGSVNMKSGGPMNLTAGGPMSLKAPVINLN